MKKIALLMLLGLVSAETDNGNYVPPYTEDEPFVDDEELEIDEHDKNVDPYEMFPEGRPKKCYGLALSDSINLGPY